MFDDAKDNPNAKIKLRFKLKSGEEFEAEGSLQIVLKQKEEFLQLIANKYRPSYENTDEQKPFPWYQNETAPTGEEAPHQTFGAAADAGGPPQTPNPHIYDVYDGETQTPTPERTTPTSAPLQTQNPFAIRARPIRIKEGGITNPPPEAPARAEDNLAKSPFALSSLSPAFRTADKTLWDKIAYCDGDDIIIRRKSKTLKPSGAALIILACAKLMKNVQELTSLELSKCMKLSGYLKNNDRLDRALNAEIKQAAITYDGTKRNRTYRLTHSGMAKAYATAERALNAAFPTQ